MSVNVNAGKGGFRGGCLSTSFFLISFLLLLNIISLWEINRMRQDLILLKQAYIGTESTLTLIGKAKTHADSARDLLRDGRNSRANDQMTLAADTLNAMDENIRRMYKEAEKQYPSILDIVAGIIGYVVNVVKGFLGGGR